jgi:hypothetical protein
MGFALRGTLEQTTNYLTDLGQSKPLQFIRELRAENGTQNPSWQLSQLPNEWRPGPLLSFRRNLLSRTESGETRLMK